MDAKNKPLMDAADKLAERALRDSLESSKDGSDEEQLEPKPSSRPKKEK